ncbi:endonuclease domain-containing protein [Terricaulis sp.]|uniref:endonuclease domain-containing protein n=1 Tax=Terricaulis sp. TaxID=2768686 RepID=UPI003784F392
MRRGLASTSAMVWLRSRAKELRRDMTPAEKTVWRILHEGELVALNWRKQAPFGDFILDFVSHPARLVVEVDGAQHGETEQALYDQQRTAWLEAEGYRVLRVWNSEAKSLADGVWRLVHHAAMQSPAVRRMDRWREQTMANIRTANERAVTSSSSMEEVARAQRGSEEVRPPAITNEPHEARPSTFEGAPPQSALRADSSSIEEERAPHFDGSVQ